MTMDKETIRLRIALRTVARMVRERCRPIDILNFIDLALNPTLQRRRPPVIEENTPHVP